jgi:hypothetical protein
MELGSSFSLEHRLSTLCKPSGAWVAFLARAMLGLVVERALRLVTAW